MESWNNKSVLIVEDNPTDLMGVYALFGHLGYKAVAAFDGEQALYEARNKYFELVILDWNLPRLSGSDFLDYLENKIPKHGRKLDVIIYTGESGVSLPPINSNSFQIVDVWSKPMGPIDMLKKLKKLSERNLKEAA